MPASERSEEIVSKAVMREVSGASEDLVTASETTKD